MDMIDREADGSDSLDVSKISYSWFSFLVSIGKVCSLNFNIYIL